ncbi:hypothetical protein PoB_000541700 [Plakobranchus ocellatus]|uniref:Uncharacterized protein n=1 Tax=Plakobranchus ocellatus TaxID=259542 RepID=A0AAV3Y8V9_9GAST|nr:hypothetical protein PoB_000541700 [Plakobranchus ocellatus]
MEQRRSNHAPTSLPSSPLLFYRQVHNKVISGFQALRPARAPVAGLEPATEGSLQISGRTRKPLCYRRPRHIFLTGLLRRSCLCPPTALSSFECSSKLTTTATNNSTIISTTSAIITTLITINTTTTTTTTTHYHNIIITITTNTTIITTLSSQPPSTSLPPAPPS